MSVFNPDTFLQSATTEKMETRRTPIPENEYLATIKDVKLRSAKESVILDVTWSILDQGAGAGLAAKMGLPEATVRQSVFLDIREDGQGLATGPNKNVQLGRIREAIGQNNPGPWMILQLKGAGPAKIMVTNRPDDKDASIVYDDVKAVSKAA